MVGELEVKLDRLLQRLETPLPGLGLHLDHGRESVERLLGAPALQQALGVVVLVLDVRVEVLVLVLVVGVLEPVVFHLIVRHRAGNRPLRGPRARRSERGPPDYFEWENHRKAQTNTDPCLLCFSEKCLQVLDADSRTAAEQYARFPRRRGEDEQRTRV